ncbi:hypothetical protein [Actinomadura sp. SCN-SB]|uniref:hypothetical protein n=1 Tax=Actinomadura sp. SCN-SB TaxID=3373092 RepID=UPI0037509426
MNDRDALYQAEVLEPARAAGDQPPEDLRVRYALPDPLTAAEVAARVKEVRQCWRRARGQLKYRKLIDRLEAEHRELAPLFAAAERGDLGPLNERLRGAEERIRARLAQARARLADAAGMLRMVTPGEVDAIARTSGVTRAELEDLARSDRIDVREPDPLPASSPYPAYRKVRESLDVLGRRHLAHFIFGGRLRGPMRVVRGFAAPGPGGEPLRLDEAAVKATAAAWAKRSRDTSTTHADTVLAALRSGADLHELVRYDLVERLRERLRQRASERALLRHALEDLDVDRDDGLRLVFAVLRETGPDGGLAGRLRALLDAGEVYAAAELAEAAQVPSPQAGEEPDDTQILAAEARRRVDTAVRLREHAVAAADPDKAWLLLADALKLVRDLPGARDHMSRLPPRPVPSVHAEVDGPVVRLTWEPSPSTAGEVGYQVVRRRERAPRGAGDGEAVAGRRDDRPPVNVPLYYGVVAFRGEAAAAPAVAGPVVVRPEPREIELIPGNGQVTGRWRCPAEAVRVEVVRDGRPVAATREGFQEKVPNGTTHHYRISAVYLDADGREVTTPGVRLPARPSAPPVPVYELDAEPDPSDPGLLRVRFERPRHGMPELVMLDRSPPWPRSAVVPLEEVRAASRRLGGAPTEDGLSVRPGSGGWLLAVTVAEGLAAIGAYHRHVHLPPPRRLVVERRGAYVHLGFDWPRDVAEVELTYRIGAGRPDEEGTVEREVVSRAAYDTQGGIRVPVPEELPVELSVASAGTVGGAPVRGRAVTAEVGARVLVHYDVERTGPPWRRALTIRLTCARPVRVRRLTLVRRDGRIMPHGPGDGETIADWEQVPVPGELSVSLPRSQAGGAGGYWLRCFAEDDVIELRDPPVRRLRVARSRTGT